jgi:hypothetical protein
LAVDPVGSALNYVIALLLPPVGREVGGSAGTISESCSRDSDSICLRGKESDSIKRALKCKKYILGAT